MARKTAAKKSGKEPEIETIILGGGCFWCTEAVFLMLKGVKSVTSGYSGGFVPNPIYELVSTGLTGHAETNKVEFDPGEISLNMILDVFFEMHDPTSLNQQGADMGTQYRSIIFYTNDRQKAAIEDYIRKRRKDYSKPIVTEEKALDKFYKAEDYHQDYYAKNPQQGYCRLVISPKLDKIRKEFAKELKK
jgi:methionine-S-sulfoxide reductase